MKMFVANTKYEYQKGRQMIGVDVHVHEIHDNTIFLYLEKCDHSSCAWASEAFFPEGH